MTTEAIQFRRDFWTQYAELYPDDGVSAGWGRAYTWIPVGSTGLNVSLAVYHWGAGLWLRGRRGELLTDSSSRIQVYKEAFWVALNETFDGAFPDGPGTEWADLEGGFDAPSGVRYCRPGELAGHGGLAALYAPDIPSGDREVTGAAGISGGCSQYTMGAGPETGFSQVRCPRMAFPEQT